MNRRSFLQSVIALPLVAVGMPRKQPLRFHPDAFAMVMDPVTGVSMRFIRSWDEAKDRGRNQYDILLEHVIALGPVVPDV